MYLQGAGFLALFLFPVLLSGGWNVPFDIAHDWRSVVKQDRLNSVINVLTIPRYSFMEADALFL